MIVTEKEMGESSVYQKGIAMQLGWVGYQLDHEKHSLFQDHAIIFL